MIQAPLEPYIFPDEPDQCTWCEVNVLLQYDVLYLPYDDEGKKCFCDEYCRDTWIKENYDEYLEEIEDYNEKIQISC